MTVPVRAVAPNSVPLGAVEVRPASPWPVFVTAAIAVFLVSIDTTVLFAAFGALRASFSVHSAADASWVINAYILVYASLLVPAGKLSDCYGSQRVFLVGLCVFSAASVACGLSNHMGGLIAARALQALGAALLSPASLALVLAAFPMEKRAVAVSLWGAVAGLAAALGPGLGALLIEYGGWRWVFWINLPAALWALQRARRILPVPIIKGDKPQLDVRGLLLLIAGVSWLTWSVISTEAKGWRDGFVWMGLACGAALLVAFVARARSTPHPALDMRLFDNRNYRTVNAATLIFGMAFTMMFFGFFFFLTGVWHYSLPMAGLAITPGPLMVVPTAMVCGKWASRYGHRSLLVAGCVLLAVGGLMQTILLGAEPAFWLQWLPCQIVTGVAVGMAMPALSGGAVASLQPAQLGQGSAVNQAVRQFGAVWGVALTVLLLGHPSLVLADFQKLSLSYAALAALASLICVSIKPAAAR